MLELLGVPPPIIAQHPNSVASESYPQAFRNDPMFLNVWRRLCLAVSPAAAPEVGWNLVLRHFLKWATRTNSMVWPDRLNRVANSELQSFLMLRRRWIIQHFDRLGVLHDLKWLRATQTVTEDRLGITVNSVLTCRDVDARSIVTKLLADRWHSNRDLNLGAQSQRDYWRWLKTSERGITRLGFSTTGTGMRASFWYSIACPAHPFVPPTETVQDFVLADIWDPVRRVLRFRTMTRPSTF